MQKIKDNIDLEELMKHRFSRTTKVYNNGREEITDYTRINAKQRLTSKGIIVEWRIIEIKVSDRILHFKNSAREVYNKNWANDLVQAGLVENVKG